MGFDPKHFWYCEGTKLFPQRSAVVTIGCSVCCLVIGTHASGISIPLSSDDLTSSFGWSILGSFLWKPYGVSLSCCLSLVRRRGASELLPSPPWVTSKRLSYDLQTKRLFLKFICGHSVKSSWRVHHHWRYHGNRALTAMFVKMFTYYTRRLGLFLLLLIEL